MIKHQNFACDPRYRVYIISWPGYHESAMVIADSIMNTAINSAPVITIVYSDHQSTIDSIDCSGYSLIRRPQELYFSDKFQVCLADAGESAVLVIHADTKCDNWRLMIEEFENVLGSSLPWGVWAPNVSGTPVDLSVSRISNIANSNLAIVSLTDAIVFALHPRVIDRLRKVNYSENLYGWGIDILFCAISRSIGLLNLVNQAIRVHHSPGGGYSHQLAREQAKDFFKQFSANEFVEAQLLLSHTQLNRIRLKVKNNESL